MLTTVSLIDLCATLQIQADQETPTLEVLTTLETMRESLEIAKAYLRGESAVFRQYNEAAAGHKDHKKQVKIVGESLMLVDALIKLVKESDFDTIILQSYVIYQTIARLTKLAPKIQNYNHGLI